MTIYNVHLYREMRVEFGGIEAETPEAAAEIASGKPTGEADAIEDCDGENLAALIDVAGDEDFRQSVTVDFEGERTRKAASGLLAALKAVLPYAENEHASLFDCWKKYGEAATESEAEASGRAIDRATSAIAAAEAAGIKAVSAPARFAFTHEPEENSDRAFVLADGIYEVAIVRTDDGMIVDIYPKGWPKPIGTLNVWDDEVAELEHGPAAAAERA